MTITSTNKQLKRLSSVQKHEIFKELSILAVSLTMIILMWQNNLVLFAILTSIYAIRAYLWHQRGNHQVFLCGGLLLSVMEVVFATTGIYQFSYPSLLNIPIWIPVAWGIGSVAVIRTYAIINLWSR